MISPEHIVMMARYNSWQNDSVVAVADELNDEERGRERDAFFGSISKTLNHVLWADEMWMHRIAGRAAPQDVSLGGSTTHAVSWASFKESRRVVDNDIVAWADGIEPSSLMGNLTWYSGGLEKDLVQPLWVLITHMFNHQTHHRGQVHCMLTQAGVKTRVTDLPAMANLPSK